MKLNVFINVEIQSITKAYNLAKHAITGFSPFQVFHGWIPYSFYSVNQVTKQVNENLIKSVERDKELIELGSDKWKDMVQTFQKQEKMFIKLIERKK